jgi:hypothetical protein
MQHRWAFVVLLSLSTGVLSPANAHHSFATYDMSAMQTIRGTVRECQWVNPHVWIYLTVVDAKGESQDYAIEAGAVIGLKRQGWSRDSFKAGDNVTVSFRPRKDGAPGGAFLRGVTAGGKVLGEPDRQLVTPTASTSAAAAKVP